MQIKTFPGTKNELKDFTVTIRAQIVDPTDNPFTDTEFTNAYYKITADAGPSDSNQVMTFFNIETTSSTLIFQAMRMLADWADQIGMNYEIYNETLLEF